MSVITAPVADYTGQVAGVEFVGGRGETDDDNALAYFRRHGYGIDVPAEQGAEKPSESWTVAELEEWAKAHDVELGDAKKKADILAAIELAAEQGE